VALVRVSDLKAIWTFIECGCSQHGRPGTEGFARSFISGGAEFPAPKEEEADEAFSIDDFDSGAHCGRRFCPRHEQRTFRRPKLAFTQLGCCQRLTHNTGRTGYQLDCNQ